MINLVAVTEQNTSGSSSISVTTKNAGDVVIAFFELQTNGATLSAGPSNAAGITWDGAAFATKDNTGDATNTRTIIGWKGVVGTPGTGSVTYTGSSSVRDVVVFELQDTDLASPTWTIAASGGNASAGVSAATFNGCSAALTSGSQWNQCMLTACRVGSSIVNSTTNTAGFQQVETATSPGGGYAYNHCLKPSTSYQPSISQSASNYFVALSCIVASSFSAPSGYPQLLAHVAALSTGGNTVTSASIDTTGASLLVVSLADDGTTSVSDSKSNTWTQIVSSGGTGPLSRLFYVANPTVGTAHTFTATASGQHPTMLVQAWSHIATTTPLDGSAGASGAAVTTLQPGSVTPTQNYDLLIAGFGDNVSALQTSGWLATIGSSFASGEQYEAVSAAHDGGGIAAFIQATAAAVNPTWADGQSGLTGATIAAFKSTYTVTTAGKVPGFLIAQQAVVRAATW